MRDDDGGAPRRAFGVEASEDVEAHSIHLFDEHPDRAAAGEPDLPGGLVGNAELDGLRLAARYHIERFGDDRALDAAARHTPEEVAFLVDHQIGADRPRRRAP